ncbi:hypothetical protein B0H66DRAFT_356075 [Apodospora peruviana]|uniref:RNase MRP protein 1 RNA binding domain-containing protein n=1 Tax=Apodospora peruviana TaxID=516989 RepID=A0AAE0HVW8_9PEZI|nr:hypothetical protein B0H66DRAFT_356075 [Apodospora peruviana]
MVTTTENEEEPLPCQKAINTLAPALDILERFHHRNKNQHRLSKWWSSADMLRRHLRKMIESLEDGFEEEEKKAKALLKKKKETSNKKMDQSGHGERIASRAEYLRHILVPRAYLAFTQLTADRQFAHLGLMLLATLAQVDNGVSGFASPASVSQQTQQSSLSSSAAGVKLETAQDGGGMMMTVDNSNEDLGVAVSRDELFFLATFSGSSTLLPKRVKLSSSATATTTPPSAVQTTAITPDNEMDFDALGTVNAAVKRRKRKENTRHDRDEEDEVNKEEIPKAKKKRRVRDDEEDASGDDDSVDIFGSSATKTTIKTKRVKAVAAAPAVVERTTAMKETGVRKKKKKKKGGDEFDDIFSSLL